jgi:hypothetical protein
MEKKKKKKKIKGGSKYRSVGYSLVKRLRFTALMCNFFFFFYDVSKFVTSYDMSSVQLDT